MKNFKEFIISPEERLAQKEVPENVRRDETVGYFNKLKKVIDEAGVKYVPGELVAVIRDSIWDDQTYPPDPYYLNRAYPLQPSKTIIYHTQNEKRRPILKVLREEEAGLPDMPILKELAEAEGLRVDLLDWKKYVGIVARIYVADESEHE